MNPQRRASLEAVPGWEWEPHTEAWERGYSVLVRFADREKHARVPKEHIEDGFGLGTWVAGQRLNREKMNAERRDRLESLPGWSWNAVTDSWNEHLAAVRDYADREGHTQVPVDYIENGLKLGQWTRLRRRERNKLSAERRAQLEALPGWHWGLRADYVWEQKYALIKQFADREGHARVSSTHVEDGVKLGSWLTMQRSTRYRLRPDQIARLEALPGWSWTVSRDTWDQRYELLREFTDREDHSRVPQGHVESGVHLGKWLSVQREKRDKLTSEQRKRLEALPGWAWNPHTDRWESTFRLLQTYTDEKGTSQVPYAYALDGVKLGTWVSEQRSQYAKGRLNPERQAGLEALPGWEWSPQRGPRGGV
jgi:hypothetical protein